MLLIPTPGRQSQVELLSLSLAGDIMSVLSCPELCNKTLSQNTQHWFVLPFLLFSLPSPPLPSPPLPSSLRLRPMDHKYESSLCYVELLAAWARHHD